MFVYDFVQLDVPYEEVRNRLRAAPTDWRYDPAEAAVSLELERAVEKDGMIAVPFRGPMFGPALLFTALEGHLEISRLGPSGTHVSMLGNYQPRDGYYGPWADRMGFHHLIEAGLRRQLRRVVDRLVDTADTLAS